MAESDDYIAYLARIQARQRSLAHPVIPWTLDDRRAWLLISRGFWIAASGWGLHVESTN